MYRYGHPGKAYGFGVYGGIDEIEWCDCDAVTASDFEEAEEAPTAPCPDD